MRRFPLNRCDGIFRFKRSWGHRTVCVALCRFSSFFITTSKTKSPFCLYMGVVVWGDILFRGASYIVSDGMSATTGTNIRRMYAVAKMYVLKLSKSLVNSKYGFNPLICFFNPIGGCFNLFNFVFSQVRTPFVFSFLFGSPNAFIEESQFE